MSYDYKGLYTNGSTGSHNNSSAVNDGWRAETGTFTITDPAGIKLRMTPNTSGSTLMILKAGQEVKYDAFKIDYNGYVWIRQPRSGSYGYMVTGEVKRMNYWGTFK